MSERQINWQADLKVFRERMGGISDAKKEWSRQQKAHLKSIAAAMKSGPHTIPELVDETHLPGDRILWYVLAMKRYGQVIEAGRVGDYYCYQLKGTQA